MTLGGRVILVRFAICDITADSCRFEQSFFDDDGRMWELSWVATDTRVGSVDDIVEPTGPV